MLYVAFIGEPLGGYFDWFQELYEEDKVGFYEVSADTRHEAMRIYYDKIIVPKLKVNEFEYMKELIYNSIMDYNEVYGEYYDWVEENLSKSDSAIIKKYISIMVNYFKEFTFEEFIEIYKEPLSEDGAIELIFYMLDGRLINCCKLEKL